ncbi:MAG: 1-deoxy-D-xylulose-5-phosphate reductoisomerase [Clostridia bacterium]|nr:1-deoxy-D-xylulose-5-phosphate reductoisomerase [Clostridia bacterium]
MKKISILGSTGSIGTQALDVVDRQKDEFKVCGLSANKNIKLLSEQIRKYKPESAAIFDESLYKDLKTSVNDCDTKILCGLDGVREVSANSGADIVLSAIVGIAGLLPTLDAIDNGIDIALANKETLVTAGKLVTDSAKKKGVKLLPVDSEHSAIFQCLNGEKQKSIKRIILTASGGPFFGKKRFELENVTVSDALNHPNWSMGSKITIDSATLMNKGLEFIEAKWLFDVEPEKIDIVVHKQSIIHSMVEFTDGSILAQMGKPDMRTPISVALNYPDREVLNSSPLDFSKLSALTFDKPDYITFKCLSLAIDTAKIGGTAPAFLNGANEAAVELFLNDKIGFLDIGDCIEEAIKSYKSITNYTLSDILTADKQAREKILQICGR